MPCDDCDVTCLRSSFDNHMVRCHPGVDFKKQGQQTFEDAAAGTPTLDTLFARAAKKQRVDEGAAGVQEGEGVPQPSREAGGAGERAANANQSTEAALRAELAAVKDQLVQLRATVAAFNSGLPGALREALSLVEKEKEAALRKARGPKELKARKISELLDELPGVLEPVLSDDGELCSLRCMVCPHLPMQQAPGRTTATYTVDQGFYDLKRAVTLHVTGDEHKLYADKAAAESERVKAQYDAGMNLGRVAYDCIISSGSYKGYEGKVLLLYKSGSRVGTLNHSRMFASDFVTALHKVIKDGIRGWLNTGAVELGNRARPFALNADKATFSRRTNQLVGMLVFVDGVIKCIFLDAHVVGKAAAEALAKRLVPDVMEEEEEEPAEEEEEEEPEEEVVDEDSLTAQLLAALGEYVDKDALKNLVSSLAVDGQYIVTNMSDKLHAALGLKKGCLSVLWDLAHKLELVMKDVRSDKTGTIALRSVEWYSKTAPLIAGMLSAFAYGKGYEVLVALSEELGVDLRDPQKFCDTRFCASEFKVFNNFLHNFRALIEYWEDESNIPDTAVRRKKSGKLSEEELNAITYYNTLCDRLWVTRTVLLRDVLGQLAKLSLKFQTVNALAWEQLEEVEKGLKLLKEMAKATKPPPVPSGPNAAELRRVAVGEVTKEHFPLLFETNSDTGKTFYDELRDGLFCAVKLSLPTEDPDDENSRKLNAEECWAKAVSDIHDFLAAAAHFYELRFIDFKSAPRQGASGGFSFQDKDGRAIAILVKHAGKVFDLRVDTPFAERKASLSFLFAAAKKAGVVFPVSEADAMAELELLCTRLADARKSAAYSERWIDKETKMSHSGSVIMADLFTKSDLYIGIGGILWLFQYFALKSANEAVNEGMGSVVDLHAGGRRHLSQEKYSKEAFIQWNGPSLAHADAIIRKALDEHFGGRDKWHFQQTSEKGMKGKWSVESQVIYRLKNTPPKLPFLTDARALL